MCLCIQLFKSRQVNCQIPKHIKTARHLTKNHVFSIAKDIRNDSRGIHGYIVLGREGIGRCVVSTLTMRTREWPPQLSSSVAGRGTTVGRLVQLWPQLPVWQVKWYMKEEVYT